VIRDLLPYRIVPAIALLIVHLQCFITILKLRTFSLLEDLRVNKSIIILFEIALLVTGIIIRHFIAKRKQCFNCYF